MSILMLANSSELTLLFFSLGGLFIPFLFSDLVKGSSSGLLFSLVSCNLNLYVTHLQFIWGSSHPSGWSGGHLGIIDWRALTVQIHGDRWGRLKTGTIIGKIEAANAVPPMLALKLENELEGETNLNSKLIKTSKEQATTSNLNSTVILPEKHKLTQEETDLLMSKIDFSGIKDWEPEQQKEAKDLILEYGSLFALKDMDLGRTDRVKHSIK